MLKDFVRSERSHLEAIANTARGLCLDTVLRSKSGHIGLPLGATEITTLLYFGLMKHDPTHPEWEDRDRFVLSAGHGSALLYSMLHLSGYDLSIHDLEKFRQINSRTPGHPEFGLTPGVECTTGPLGQGFAMAVGMALAESHLASRFHRPEHNIPLLDHRTYVLAGDGCLMEGISSEAASLAGFLKLNKLIVAYDDNRITIDGHTDITFDEDVKGRFAAVGWNVFTADGHDFDSLAEAFDSAHAESMKGPGTTGPSLVICRTIAGKGLKRWENQNKAHGNPYTADDVAEAKAQMGLDPQAQFFVSAEVMQHCRRLIADRSAARKAWMLSLQEKKKLDEEPLCAEWSESFETLPSVRFGADDLEQATGSAATRQFSGKALQIIAEEHKRLMGGSADLAGSNASTISGTSFLTPENHTGRNIHFGVREHAMAAITNGLALHGGLTPYCATFAVFSDYMRPAIRLAALMQIPSIFILTHDSYAVGEDGPTHQPIEHANALRLIPNLNVFRPADGLETFAAWQFAVESRHSPSALLLTRQKVDSLDLVLNEHGFNSRLYSTVHEGVLNGAYLVKDFSEGNQKMQVILAASGSEATDTLRAAFILETQTWEKLDGTPVNLAIRMVSVPALSSLLQSPHILNALLPEEFPCVAVEAGSTMGFAGIVGRHGAVLGLDRFGESAPAEVLQEHFGFTPRAIALRTAQFLKLRECTQH